MRDFWCGNCGAHLTRETEDAHRCAATVPTSPTDTGDNGLRGACILALSNHSHADTCASELSPNAGYDCTCWRKVLVDALAAHSAIGGDE